jgi:hypothetical protein
MSDSWRHEEMEDERDEQALDESIYPVKCECGWFGMSDDVGYNLCPHCGRRVMREFEEGL